MRNSYDVKRRISRWLAATCLLVGLPGVAAAISPDGVWDEVSEASIARTPAARQIVPQRYRTVQLSRTVFEQLLATVPLERNVALDRSDARLWLPLPDGGFGEFSIVESPVMEPGLANKYPDIRTWVGQGIDDPSATLRFDQTPKGFHAQIISERGTVFIDPFQPGDQQNYISYRKADHLHGEQLRCSVTGEQISKESPTAHSHHAAPKLSSGATLRTYRLAVAATGEYTTFHGGGVADGLAGIVTTINRVNGIYEREVSVRMVLVANNDLIIYTNPAGDPYANSSGDLNANQSNINLVIGSANYDFGHLMGTGGGGVAQLGVICSGSKARGLTGSGSPVGDGFDVDYVAHEMGHQFAGGHTFNGTGGSCGGNIGSSAAYETGSGVTIQAYAGICDADDLQPNSEDYFHRVSLNQIIAHTTTGSGSTCGVTNATGNAIPTVSTPAAFTIPRQTPFKLTATGADGDAGDSLTYLWEQFDLGAANAPGALVDNGGPLFRPFAPTRESTRIFPSLRYILNNANAPPATAPLPGTAAPNFFTGELLPSTNRTMNFRVTVRDNRAAGGGTNEALTALTVTTAAGPFNVTAPNTAVTFPAGSSQTVTWNVANTNAAPVNTANVRITLSLDGGFTWPVELAASEANDGSASVTIPAATPSTTQARVRIEAIGNVYFDVSDANFSITGANSPPAISGIGSVATRQGSPTATAVVATVSDTQDAAGTLGVSVSNVPPELQVVVSNVGGSVSFAATASCSLVAPTGGSRAYPILLHVTDSQGATSTASINVNLSANQAPTLGTYSNLALARNATAPNSPSAAPADPNGNFVGLAVSPATLPGGGTVTVAANGIVTSTTTAGTIFGAYPIRVQASDTCGAVEIRQFTLTVAATTPVLDVAGTSVISGNGLIEPNECNQFNLSLANSGPVAATAVSATISSSTPNVTITQPTAAFANIAPGATGTSLTPFEISTGSSLACFSNIQLSLNVTYTGGGSPFVDTIDLTVGQPALTSYVFTSSTGATIPAGGVFVAGSNVDDGLVSLTVPAGFNFSVYGTTITGGSTLRASTNGNLQLTPTGGSSESVNGPLPSTGAGGAGQLFPANLPVLMPWWDNMLPTTTGGGIYTNLVGTAPNRRWIVEWRGRNVGDGATTTNTVFAIVLKELSNEFEFLYAQTGVGPSLGGLGATIGVQAASTGTAFTQRSLNSNSVSPGTRLSATLLPAVCNAGSGSCGPPGPGVTVVQSAGNTSVTEGGAGDSYTVVLDALPSGNVQVNTTSGADTTSTSGVTFTTLNWNVPQTITVAAVDDRVVEGAHSGTISHLVSGGGYDGVTIPDVAVSIADNDTASYRFTTATISVGEGSGSTVNVPELVFATSGSGPQALEAAITVPYSIGGASTATGGGVDYSFTSPTFGFATSGAQQLVGIAPNNDAIIEGAETVVVTLGQETGGSVGQQAAVTAGSPSTQTITITDDDVPGVSITQSAGSTGVTEGGAGDAYSIVLTTQPTGTVTVTVTPDADLSATPLVLTYTTATWDIGQVVNVSAVDDTDVEGAHTGTISHSASGGGYNGVGIASLDVAITDNDGQSADLAVSNVLLPGPIGPGDTLSYEVTINNLSPTVDVATAAFAFTAVPALDNASWTCTAEAGATCPAAGTGLPAHAVSLDAGTGVLYAISGDVPAASALGSTIDASATISVTTPYSDPNALNNSDSVTTTVAEEAIFADGFESP